MLISQIRIMTALDVMSLCELQDTFFHSFCKNDYNKSMFIIACLVLTFCLMLVAIIVEELYTYLIT